MNYDTLILLKYYGVMCFKRTHDVCALTLSLHSFTKSYTFDVHH